jgi:hypothetical protein
LPVVIFPIDHPQRSSPIATLEYFHLQVQQLDWVAMLWIVVTPSPPLDLHRHPGQGCYKRKTLVVSKRDAIDMVALDAVR